jgi:hypothetical protein
MTITSWVTHDVARVVFVMPRMLFVYSNRSWGRDVASLDVVYFQPCGTCKDGHVGVWYRMKALLLSFPCVVGRSTISWRVQHYKWAPWWMRSPAIWPLATSCDRLCTITRGLRQSLQTDVVTNCKRMSSHSASGCSNFTVCQMLSFQLS